MTWIVGMPTMFGYSIGISDIRVTLADGSEHDCLQKIYPVASSIALGFAGSVYIGFRMVQVMRTWLRCDEPDRAWNPLETVEQWPEIAKEVFTSSPLEEQAAGCHLIMLSADPIQRNGMAPLTYVHIFRSPEFVPIQIHTHKAAGIGCGNFIERYQQYLDDISNKHEDNFNLMKMEAGMPGGMGGILGFSLTNMLKETNPSGISSHLHYCWVYLGRTIIKTNDHVTIGKWTALGGGSGINDPDQSGKSAAQDAIESNRGVSFTMPTIAQSWHELTNILNGSGARAEGSVT